MECSHCTHTVQSLMCLSMWCPTARSVGYRGASWRFDELQINWSSVQDIPITKFPCRMWRLLGISHIQCTYAVYWEHSLFWDIFRGTCVIESLTTGASSLSEPHYNTPLMGGVGGEVCYNIDSNRCITKGCLYACHFSGWFHMMHKIDLTSCGTLTSLRLFSYMKTGM